MSINYVSIDAGNGFTNAATLKGKSVKTVGFPSIRAMSRADDFDIEGFGSVNYPIYNWQGLRYVVGDDASLISLDSVESHRGYNRYGNEMQRFFMAVAMYQLGLKSSDIDLTMFVPPSLLIEQKDTILSRFEDVNNQLAILPEGERKPIIYNLVNINIVPEGIGAATCFMLDKRGKPSQSASELSGNVLFVDIGMYTTDVVLLQNGAFNRESLSTATSEGFGIADRILSPLAEEVRKKAADFSAINLYDIDRALRNGLKTGEFTVSSGLSNIDIEERFNAYKGAFSNAVADLLDSQYSSLRNVQKVVLVGGGATFINDLLAETYPNRTATLENYSSMKDVSPLEANVIGGLRLSLMKQLQTE